MAWDGAQGGGVFRTIPAGSQVHVVPWAPSARRTLDLAERVVRLAAPLLGATPTTQHLRLDSACLPGLAEAEKLEGPSFGASLFLALMSQVLGRPVPGHLAASATIDLQGNLGTVDRIEEKLDAILRCAPGISTFVVAPEQSIAARLKRRAKAGKLKIEEVKDVDALMALAWGELDVRDARLPASEAEALAEKLYLFSLSRRAMVSWEHFRAAADRVRGALAPGSAAWLRADFASKVAARHEGSRAEALPLLEPAELAAMHRPLRMKHLAQIVQSHSDSGSERLGEVLDWAAGQLPAPLESSEGDLELRGAIGRALAVLGRRREARDWLEETVRLWFAIEHACEAGLSLCELIRLTGLEGPAAAVEATLGMVQEVVDDARTDLDSRSFLRLALGRAWIQVGEAERGQEVLERDDLDWTLARKDVQVSRLRWLASAARRLGRGAGARDLLANAEALPRKRRRVPLELWLGRLDDARARGADTSAAVRAITKDYGGLCRHLWRGRPAADRPRILAEEFPY